MSAQHCRRVALGGLGFFLAVTGSATELAPSGGFENGFQGWTRWGANANLTTLMREHAHSGTHCARIEHGKNVLYFTSRISRGQAYELSCFFRLEGTNASGQVALNFSTKGGALNSAGRETLQLQMPTNQNAGEWSEFRKTFLPPRLAATCQFAFSAGVNAALWLDDVSLKEVARPAGLTEPPDPWEGLKRRTQNPLFKELLGETPGQYTVVCWSHDLTPPASEAQAGTNPPTLPEEEVRAIFREAGEAGMGFLDLPGRLDGREPWWTPEFHLEQFQKYNVRYDVWTEGSGSVAAALKNGAEILNPSGKALGRRPSVSWVDPKYVEAQEQILRALGRQMRNRSADRSPVPSPQIRNWPFVGYYYGKDEPTVHLPEGSPERWGPYGQAMAKEVREKYGFGRLDPPVLNDPHFETDRNRALRWIAYNRWANDKFIESRCRLFRALHEEDPGARYSPADYWFMSGFVAFDYSRLAACSDLVELDPYASSGERSRGRGVFNHGFGAKFMSDLVDKPVRIVAQAFDYAGYDMAPDDLREWVSQAMRCGAGAIDYYTMDRPRATHPDRWRMMLHLSKTITRLNRIRLPENADTAVLYTLYTHMGHGEHTSGDQVYAAHALLGELAGSWFRFVSDAQLERGDRDLGGFKVVYLPLGKYLTAEATRRIEAYVRSGGTLVCADAEAFSFDLAGNDTGADRERILGVKTLGPKAASEIVLQVDGDSPRGPGFGLAAGSRLTLFNTPGARVGPGPQRVSNEVSPDKASTILLADPQAEVLGKYADGSPAIVSRRLGKGRVITFAANPFTPQVVVTRACGRRLSRACRGALDAKWSCPSGVF